MLINVVILKLMKWSRDTMDINSEECYPIKIAKPPNKI